MEKITVIVPCYNEQEALHYYYEEMSRVMNEMKEVDFELLFINDGSKDKTLKSQIYLIFKKLWKRISYVCWF